MKGLAIMLLLIGCAKEQELSPEGPMSVSYIIDEYDSNWRFLRSFESYHVCKVWGDELRRFNAIGNRIEQICNETRNIRLVVIQDKDYHKQYHNQFHKK